MNYYVWLILFSTLFSLPTYAAPAVDEPTKADMHNESGHRHDKGDKAHALGLHAERALFEQLALQGGKEALAEPHYRSPHPAGCEGDADRNAQASLELAIRHAKTKAEHLALAAYYSEEARLFQGDATWHERMAKVYETGNYAKAKKEEAMHRNNAMARKSREMAEENLALAQMHRQLAERTFFQSQGKKFSLQGSTECLYELGKPSRFMCSAPKPRNNGCKSGR